MFSMLTEWFGRTLKAGSKARVIHLQGTVATEAQMLIAVLHGAMLSARATNNCDVFRSLSQSEMNRISPRKTISQLWRLGCIRPSTIIYLPTRR